MRTIKHRSTGKEIQYLEEILQRLGYDVYVSNYFGKDTDAAIKDFQGKHNLVVDGIVGLKTWSKLFELDPINSDLNEKHLSENDLVLFANEYDLELAAVKAVNEIESSGKGFLIDGRPKILFEGHIFWKQLKKRDINPESILNTDNADVLYKKWTRKHYKGGVSEYLRLDKASTILPDPKVHDAAFASASWGSFQIMGYHFERLGYASINSFVNKMMEHEREHLIAFGKYLEVTNILRFLKSKNWARFAKGYNGPAYATNKYDVKLKNAYERYKTF